MTSHLILFPPPDLLLLSFLVKLSWKPGGGEPIEGSYIEQPPGAQVGGGEWGADTERQTEDAQHSFLLPSSHPLWLAIWLWEVEKEK